MTLYNQWMASSYHRQIFKFAARVGYFGWMTICCGLCLVPWFMFADLANYTDFDFAVTYVGLASLATFMGTSGLRYFPEANGGIWLSVETRYGVIGVHMWKQFPSRHALQSVAIAGVEIATELGTRLVRIESPLLVKDGRVRIWGSALRRSLAAAGLADNVEVRDVAPKPMWSVRAAFFAVGRKLGNYDQEGKHLPPAQGIGCPTAGFEIHVTHAPLTAVDPQVAIA